MARLAPLAPLALLLLEAPAALSQQTLFTANGDGAADSFGQVVDVIGDVNGDGCADGMVGAWRDDNNGKTDSGSLRIVSGKDGTTLFTIDGDLALDHMGWGSSAAGDLDGDGVPDVAAAADEADIGGIGNAGTVKAISGATKALLFAYSGNATNDLLGWSAGRVGDVNADGKDDFVVGAILDDATGKPDCGSAALLSGATGLPLYTWFGDATGDQFGYSCYGAGDANGDGVPDVIVGAPNAAGTGRARLFSGATGLVLRNFGGDSAGDAFGRSVCGAGDVNLDGRADLVVGAHQDDNAGADSGSARLFSGATFQPLVTWNGDAAGDRLGQWVRGAGDLDGDGYPDVAVGIPGDDNHGADSGSLRAYSGKTLGILATASGDSAGDALGTSVGSGGDLDGDGFDDLVAGAPGDDNNGSASGSARAFSWVPPGIAHFGAGTPGCAGLQLVNGASPPKVGNAGFAVVGNHAPPGTLGLLLAADANLPAGSDPFGLGATLHVDLLTAGLVLGIDYLADAKGSSAAAVPIPNDPLLAGKVVTFQSLHAWTTPCGLGPFGISTSIAAVATIAP